MNPHDYIISVNEQGEPYLAHALFGNAKGSQKKNHKYYTRVEDKGRWRYFYSPEEFRIWSSGGSKPKVSTTDKMRSAFKTLKETGQKVVEKAKDAAGVDERQRMKAAEDKLNSDSTNAMNRFKRHTDYTKAKSEYDNTLLGKTERMKNEFRKKAGEVLNEAADKVKDKVQSKVDEMKDIHQRNKEQVEKTKEYEKAKAEQEKKEAELASRPTAHQKTITGDAKEGSVYKRERLSEHEPNKQLDAHKTSERGDYDKNDPDFSDENYDKADRIGDSDFLTFKREDGTSVILEEDMKWVLPKGVNGDDPEIKKAIDNFCDLVRTARQQDPSAFPRGEWDEEIQRSIDSAVANAALRKNSENSSAKYSSYTDGDPDFSDENYDKATPIGDSEFYTFNRKDGTPVILEEDMKWVLPKGVDPNAPSIQRVIKKLSDNPEAAIGKSNYTWLDWTEAATQMLNEAVADAGMSEEYLEDREFNSRKNK